MAKGTHVTGQHSRLDSKIQNLQGRTEQTHTEDVSVVMMTTDFSLHWWHTVKKQDIVGKKISKVTVIC